MEREDAELYLLSGSYTHKAQGRRGRWLGGLLALLWLPIVSWVADSRLRREEPACQHTQHRATSDLSQAQAAAGIPLSTPCRRCCRYRSGLRGLVGAAATTAATTVTATRAKGGAIVRVWL